MAGICGILSSTPLSKEQLPQLYAMSKALSRADSYDDGLVLYSNKGIQGQWTGQLTAELQEPTLDKWNQLFESASEPIIGMVSYRHFRYFPEHLPGDKGVAEHDNKTSAFLYGRLFTDEGLPETESDYFLKQYISKENSFADELNGKFSGIIHDPNKNRFILSHDRFGQETLFYSEHKNSLFFGTNIRSLLAHKSITAEPHYESLWHGLSFPCTPQPNTSFSGIKALPKAHNLYWNDGIKGIDRYHQLPYCQKDGSLSMTEYAELIESTLDRAVRRQVQNVYGAGSLLSGGLDSTFYTALGKKHNADIKAVTLALAGDQFSAADESEVAAINANMHGVPHEAIYKEPEYVLNHWSEVIDNFEQPGSTFNTYYFAGKVAQEAGFTNVLTGMGADELFGGFGFFRYIRMWRSYLWGASLWAHLPRGIHKKVDTFSEMFEAREMIDFYTHNFVVMKEKEKREIWPKAKYNTYEHIRALYPEATKACDDVDVMLHLMTENTPHEQMYRMNQSMKDHGLFGLHPFMDNDFVDLAMRIPADLKVQGMNRKIVLKEAAKKWVSPEALSIHKLGFSFPMGFWLENDLKQESSELLHSLYQRGFIDPNKVEKLRKRNDAFFPKKTYKLLFLEKWFQHFID